MEKIQFLVQGSAGEPYQITFKRRSPTNLSAYCTCPAGENGLYCKHRFRILDGIAKNIVSENPDDIKTVLSWLPGTDVEKSLTIVRKLESEFEALKTELTARKKELARVMRD